MNKREIKFRAWNTLLNQFIEDFKSKYLIEVLSADLFIINQFTGLKDKNNVEIYEGDIFIDMLNTKDLGIVKFGEYNHCFDKQQLIDFGNHIGFYVEFNYKGTRKDLKYWAKNSEIIGNIYQNTELI